jgi:hypothetical protein
MLDDENATVSISSTAKGESILFIRTTDSQSVIEERLTNALKGLSLFGKQQESTTPVDIK